MISTRGRYALRVLLDIAEQKTNGYIRLDEISNRQNISEKYLESILVVLTREGLLCGQRGKGGGYKLTKPLNEYTIESILRLTETSLSPVSCLKDGAEPCEKESECKTLPLWKGLNEIVHGYLQSVTLADLLKEE